MRRGASVVAPVLPEGARSWALRMPRRERARRSHVSPVWSIMRRIPNEVRVPGFPREVRVRRVRSRRCGALRALGPLLSSMSLVDVQARPGAQAQVAAPVQTPAGPVFAHGQAQIVPVFADSTEWIRHDLWVETEFDSDGDGRPDRMHVSVVRPKQTDTEGLKVPVIYETSPYFAGTGSGNLRYFWDVRHEIGETPPPRLEMPPAPVEPSGPPSPGPRSAPGCPGASPWCTRPRRARACPRAAPPWGVPMSPWAQGGHRLAERPCEGLHQPGWR
jgi:hypothetical protein